MPQKPRADARSNRERVVVAARETFAEAGLEAPMREVARRAGVGVATLYRHFPTRAELVTTVLTDRVQACGVQMRHALDDPDPWRALSGTIVEFADRQVHDQALNEALLGSGELSAAFRDERREHSRALDVLVDRARAAGVLRDGVDVDDVRAALLAIASLRRLPPTAAARVVGRVTGLVLAGIRA
ncbi:TetR/AcrR family transcriptional regulator [Micromonospora sp. NPDC049175]|uniref:TetR/AcrR family transcriptional regulator n=1 Tax=Micromonospora sp. NPDC049175 TaxID=3364266 RepID=UPI003724920A